MPYLGFGTYYGNYGSAARSGCSGYLESQQIEYDDGGNFEIMLSCQEKAGNWLPMEHDTSMLIVRQNFLDKDNETAATLNIERIGAEGPPAPLHPETLVQGLADSAAFVKGTASLFAKWAEDFMATPNLLIPLDPKLTGGAHGDPNIFFHMGYWRLEAGEALVVEGRPPDCEYWNFQLNNHWMESLDYRYHSVHYNKHSTSYEDDGSFRLIISHEDPGLPNWLDTAGHDRGTMGLRWVKADSHPQPQLRVVKLSELTSIGQ